MIMIHLKTSSYFSAAHTGAEDTVDSVVMTEITVLMQGKGKNKQSLDRWIWADDILEESDNTCRITNRGIQTHLHRSRHQRMDPKQTLHMQHVSPGLPPESRREEAYSTKNVLVH